MAGDNTLLSTQGDTRMCRSSDLEPWAYVQDTTNGKLYEVGTQYGALTQRAVKLIDVSSDVDQPKTTDMLLANALKRLRLVRAAPTLDGTASIEEWGPAG
jgi:hypothetical protein